MALTPNERIRELESLLDATDRRRKSLVKLTNDSVYFERRLENARSSVEAARGMLNSALAALAELESITGGKGFELIDQCTERIVDLGSQLSRAKHAAQIERLQTMMNEINSLEQEDE